MFWGKRHPRVFVFGEDIDMRCGFEKLSGFVLKMQKNLDDGDVFLFFGKNPRRMKVLFFDGSGLVFIHKRLEKKTFMRRSELEKPEITLKELKWILHGSVLRSYSISV